jgi:hypothetical protein
MKKTFHGSCHCGALRFTAEIDLAQGIRKCNCSFCWKLGYRKSLVPYDALQITNGKSEMREYAPKKSNWPPGDIDHYYCGDCATHTFSRGYLEKEMGGNFWAVNVACLDDITEEELDSAPAIYEDGKRDRQDRVPELNRYL